jgi:uncharacterized surface protein with fasciclin (FAS1) repeats
MKIHRFSGLFRTTLLLILLVSVASCTDYIFESQKPSWLGESIYEQLQAGYTNKAGTNYTFNNFTRLIDDLDYSEVLKLTGSKTLFVADDAAFDRFYANNAWGVRSYDGLTRAQKKLLLNSAMINNAYLIELLSNIEGPVEGQSLRHTTALSVLDTITYQQPNELPANNTSWDAYRGKGIYLVKDNTPIPMVHFLERQMRFKGISNDDFSVVFNGTTRTTNDAHVFGLKVLERDITCKNGYIDILDNVLVPSENMAEVIRSKPETQIFSSMLERFCAPYYNETATNNYKLQNPEFTDSIFSKKYFATLSSSGQNKVNNYNVVQAGFMDYDPGWNTYNTGGTNAMQTDMGVMFVPENDVIVNFFNSGGGKFLIEKYGTVDKIPNSVLVDLIKNHMKPSFLSALPHNFGQVLDDGKQPMGITKQNVLKSYLANNGVVYVTDKIYAPASYVAVTAPILVNDSTKVFGFEVKNIGFDAYLLSMDSRYSLVVPWDRTDVNAQSIGLYYVDPVSYAKKQSEILRFRYVPKNNTISCTAFKYNKTTGAVGDSIRVVTAAEINDRFEDFLDYHIVVGDIEDGKEYYRTKGGGEIKIVNNGVSHILGGGNLENSTFWPKVTKVYDQTKETNGRGNGKTYFLNSPLLPPYRSVYNILSDTTLQSQFGEFYKLLLGSDQFTAAEAEDYGIFYKDPKYIGMDFNVRSFNTFHYTVYVPTNQAVLNAIANGLPTWELINQQTNKVIKDSLSSLLSNFLKYHFQDNSIYIDGSSQAQTPYETAAFTVTGKKAYYRLYTKLTRNGLALYNNAAYSGTPVNVIKDNNLYNMMARDYKFNTNDIEKATLIETSSFAVIHQIDNVLLYQNNLLSKAQALLRSGKRISRK